MHAGGRWQVQEVDDFSTFFRYGNDDRICHGPWHNSTMAHNGTMGARDKSRVRVLTSAKDAKRLRCYDTLFY